MSYKKLHNLYDFELEERYLAFINRVQTNYEHIITKKNILTSRGVELKMHFNSLKKEMEKRDMQGPTSFEALLAEAAE